MTKAQGTKEKKKDKLDFTLLCIKQHYQEHERLLTADLEMLCLVRV
jgi:hypothetical protein